MWFPFLHPTVLPSPRLLMWLLSLEARKRKQNSERVKEGAWERERAYYSPLIGGGEHTLSFYAAPPWPMVYLCIVLGLWMKRVVRKQHRSSLNHQPSSAGRRVCLKKKKKRNKNQTGAPAVRNRAVQNVEGWMGECMCRALSLSGCRGHFRRYFSRNLSPDHGGKITKKEDLAFYFFIRKLESSAIP